MIRRDILKNAQATLASNDRSEHYGLCYIDSSTPTDDAPGETYGVVVEFADGYMWTDSIDEWVVRERAASNHDTLTDTLRAELEGMRLTAWCDRYVDHRNLQTA